MKPCFLEAGDWFINAYQNAFCWGGGEEAMRSANKTDKRIARSSESLGFDHSYVHFNYVRVAVAEGESERLDSGID